jgi:hypothetical protein
MCLIVGNPVLVWPRTNYRRDVSSGGWLLVSGSGGWCFVFWAFDIRCILYIIYILCYTIIISYILYIYYYYIIHILYYYYTYYYTILFLFFYPLLFLPIYSFLLSFIYTLLPIYSPPLLPLLLSSSSLLPLIHSILVGTYIYLFIFQTSPNIWPRTFYRSGWLRCDVFKCIGILFEFDPAQIIGGMSRVV